MSDDTEEKRSPQLQIHDGGLPDREEMSKLKGTFLDVYGENFMGSGLGFSDYLRMGEFLRYERWLGNQARDEKRRRMGYLIKLCAEQERIVEEDISATGISQGLIESLIEGDWNGVKCDIGTLKFEEERKEWRDPLVQRFAKFVEIAQEAYDTRPKLFCPVCRKPTPKQNVGSWKDGRHECPWCNVIHNEEGDWVEKSKAHLSPVEETPDE